MRTKIYFLLLVLITLINFCHCIYRLKECDRYGATFKTIRENARLSMGHIAVFKSVSKKQCIAHCIENSEGCKSISHGPEECLLHGHHGKEHYHNINDVAGWTYMESDSKSNGVSLKLAFILSL